MRRLRFESGQTTAEYALVLLVAAAVAVVLYNWVTKTSALTSFFDAIMSKIAEMI